MMFADPSVAFPTYGNPEGLIKQEHATPSLTMVTLGCRDALIQQSQIHLTPAVLRETEPLLDLGLVKTLLRRPLRRAAGNGAEALILS
jgi:hypothetical protein